MADSAKPEIAPAELLCVRQGTRRPAALPLRRFGAPQRCVERRTGDAESTSGISSRFAAFDQIGRLRIFFSSRVGRRPSLMPCFFAAAKPARVRSMIRERSNSESAAMICSTKRPPALSVSMGSERERKLTPRLPRSAIVSTRWDSDRPRRSSFQTTSVSPGRSALSARVSCGRVAALPLTPQSARIFLHPAAFRASRCRFRCWSVVETGAYPITSKCLADSGLTRGGFRYVLFLSRNRSFSGQAFGESLMAEGRKTAPFSNV